MVERGNKMNNYQEKIHLIIKEVEKVFLGKRHCVEQVLCAILSEGHILIEDMPGVGKTTLAKTIAYCLDLDWRRMQFTSDIMPSDVIGFNMYRTDTQAFVYQEGAIMCNLFLADEINRTSPKTQSALLEVMEEHSVTVDGVTRTLPKPFIMIATENPIGYIGTQMLPESQLDRFIACIVIGYPEKMDEIAILKSHTSLQLLDQVNQVVTKEELLDMQEQVKNVYINDEIYQYIVDLATETRNHKEIDMGLSPRGSMAVVSMARANAFIKGRNYVQPKDVYESLNV